MKKIILISGKANHGKDALAEYLKEQLENQGSKVAVDRFAKYIKSYLKSYYGWNGVDKDEFIRTKLQQLGTERIKDELNYKSFHAKRLAEDFQIVSEDFDYFLVPDTRFRDEIYTMKAMFPDDCIAIRVNRYDFKSPLTEEQLKHRSECDLDKFKFDHTLHTRKTDITQLYDEADKFLNKLMEGEFK